MNHSLINTLNKMALKTVWTLTYLLFCLYQPVRMKTNYVELPKSASFDMITLILLCCDSVNWKEGMLSLIVAFK